MGMEPGDFGTGKAPKGRFREPVPREEPVPRNPHGACPLKLHPTETGMRRLDRGGVRTMWASVSLSPEMSP